MTISYYDIALIILTYSYSYLFIKLIGNYISNITIYA